MELLLLFMLSPSVILAQRYPSSVSSNPNDEPFLPIYPVYPYSPKLIKRGTDRDISGQLTPELYAPKLDAKDSYTGSYNENYQRDPYYPNYNPYPKASTTSTIGGSSIVPTYTYPATSLSAPSTYSTSNVAYTAPSTYSQPSTYTPYSAGYTNPYPYSPTPYSLYNSYTNPYNAGPYPASPYPGSTYPNYNYQAPYYYPNYYNQPYPALPPPPPPPGQEYPGSANSDDSLEENDPPGKERKKSEGKKNRYKDTDDDSSAEAKDGQFVDGGNYLSSGTKDLDGQSTTYKTPPSPYNKLEHSDIHLRSVTVPGLPRTTYRVISVGGQPVGPDYPLPQSYAKVQQLEQLMSQTLAKLLAAQNAGAQASQFQFQSNQQSNPGNFGSAGLVNKAPVIAKTGLGYVGNSGALSKTSSSGQFVSNYGNQNPVIIKVQDPGQINQQASTLLSKAAGKYAESHYPQKSVTTVSLQQAPGIYIPPEAKTEKDEIPSQSSEYNDYDSQTGQNYETPNVGYKKNEQSYSIDQGSVPYHSSNLVTVQTPQAQNYQYSSYLPTQSSQQQQQQQQPRDYKTSLDDVNFGTKRNSKV